MELDRIVGDTAPRRRRSAVVTPPTATASPASHPSLQPADPPRADNFGDHPALPKVDVAEVLATEVRHGRSRKFVTGLIVVAAVVAVLGAGLWAWSSLQAHSTNDFTTDQVTRGAVTATLVATGTLQATTQIAVSSLTTGTIASIDVDYNQTVIKGQALAHLKMDDLASRLRRAVAMVDLQSANRDVAAAALADANAALARAKGLTSGEIVSVRDIELAGTAAQRAEANLAAARAQLGAAEADLAGAQSDYAKGTIVSPIDGVVLDVNAHPGDTIGTAAVLTSLFTIAADLRTLELDVDVDEADVAQVKVGDKVVFTVEAAPDRALSGIIRQVRSGPTVTDGVTSYKAAIAVDNRQLLLKPGMTATAEISTDEADNVLTVSNAALRFTPVATPSRGLFGSLAPQSTIEAPLGGQEHVYVLHDGQLKVTNVTAGLSDGQRTAIVGGDLALGDFVVTGVKGH